MPKSKSLNEGEVIEELAKIIGECGDEYYLSETASPETIAKSIITKLKEQFGYRSPSEIRELERAAYDKAVKFCHGQFDANLPIIIEASERAAMERVRQALNKKNEPDAAEWQDGGGRKLSKVLLFTKRQWDKFWKDVESELLGKGEG